MKKIVSGFIVFTGVVILFSAMTAIAGEIAIDGKVTIDDDKLREIVKEVIKDNPKLILDTINAHVKKQKKEKQGKQLEASFKNPITDIVAEPHNPSKGAENALITIIEYTDFECPYCSKGVKTVNQVLKKYAGKVKLVFKNNPLDFHKQAVPAANAALAANKQGKFWEYHDLLFKNSSKLNEELFVKLAKDLKLDMEKFDKDRNSDEITDQVELEKAEAESHKLRGTPSFLVNGIVIRGAQNLGYFSKVIDRLLSEAEKK